MIDVGTISAALSSLNVASKFVKNYLDQIKDVAVREKLEELLNAIIPLQTHIITLQAMNSASVKEIESLEKKLREIEDWTKEANRYDLKELTLGVYVYMKKPDSTHSSPIHYLCTNCFDVKKQKSILQRTDQDGLGIHYKCNNCGSEILDHSEAPPDNYYRNEGGGPNSWMGA